MGTDAHMIPNKNIRIFATQDGVTPQHTKFTYRNSLIALSFGIQNTPVIKNTLILNLDLLGITNDHILSPDNPLSTLGHHQRKKYFPAQQAKSPWKIRHTIDEYLILQEIPKRGIPYYIFLI